ncbi:acetyltransferase (GNAT) domain protein [Candidatus Magnetomorum sp. HK-1]|nr:acetyltransferase (GNAT) domain protein [Candidatus Magnetomorum sp. HK-1]
MKNKQIVYIEGKNILLRPLLDQDFTIEYLEWLNDPFINEYSQRRPFPISFEALKDYNNYYLKNPQKGFVLAIVEKKDNIHIGNISLVNIQPVNRCAEIAILIGNKKFWNLGYGKESIYLLTKHSFFCINLHKIFAGSFNPAFVKCVQGLGWKNEGDFRERIWSNGKYHNQIWLSILNNEFNINEKYEVSQ